MKIGLVLLLVLSIWLTPAPTNAQSSEEVSNLIDELKSEYPLIRADAAMRLGLLGPAAKEAVPDLILTLKDPQDRMAALNAAHALGQIGKDSVPALRSLLHYESSPENGLKELSEEEIDVISLACIALATIGPDAKEAVPELIQLLHRPHAFTFVTAAKALGSIGPAANEAISRLKEVATDSNVATYVRVEAIKALGGIGKDAIPTLIELLNSGEETLRGEVVRSIGRVGPEGIEAIPHLINVLNNKEKYTNADARREAAYALGVYGVSAQQVIPDLINVLNDIDPKVRLNGARALTNIAYSLQRARRITATGQLDTVRKALATNNDPQVRAQAGAVSEAIRILNLSQRKTQWERFLQWADQNKYVIIPLIAYLALILLWLLLLWKRPLALLKINDGLVPYTDFKLPKFLGEMKLPIRYVLGLGFLHYHHRVLDAWVAKRVPNVYQEFLEKPTVEARQIFVPMPIKFNGQIIEKLSADKLRLIFNRSKTRLLIWGEGGSGKTSIACRIAQWAMSKNRLERLCPHLMLPVLIEQEIDLKAAKGKDPLVEAIRGQLQALAGETEITEELNKRLIANRRVLIILDRFSEWSEPARQAIQPSSTAFIANALVVTSRKQEALGDLSKSTIEPIRIEGDRLSSFMEAYLALRDASDLFKDPEKFGAYQRLTIMVGKRNITVLLAKLYADHVMIASKDGTVIGSLPQNIPELMLAYVNELNQGVKDNKIDDRSIHQAIKIIAWECLNQSFRPKPSARDQIITSLGDKAEKVIEYLDGRLRIIQTIGAGQDQISFTLDPLAEYFAGLHLVDLYGSRGDEWRAFFTRMDEITDDPESIKDFLLAVRDCCLARGEGAIVPAFVPIELARRANQLDEQEIQQRIESVQRNILVQLILFDGVISKKKLYEEMADFSHREIDESCVLLVQKGWAIENEGTISFYPNSEADFYKKLAEIYKLIFRGTFPVQLFASQFYDSHINEQMVNEIRTIQGGLPLISEDVERCVNLLKVSPSAFARALHPDPMIVNHRGDNGVKEDENIDLLDRNYFFNALSESLSEDFVNPMFGELFFSLRGIRELSSSKKILLKNEKGIAIEVETIDRRGVVKFVWERNDEWTGKYVSVLLRIDEQEPWEKAANQSV